VGKSQSDFGFLLFSAMESIHTLQAEDQGFRQGDLSLNQTT